jgi:hypothetical protein
MTGPEVRAQLATVIAGVVPAGWTVYAGPPEIVSLPAVVVQTPSRRPGTFCHEIYAATITSLEARPAGLAGYDSVDVVAATIVPALTTIAGLAYQSTDLEQRIVGGVEAYGSVINVELYV